MDDHECGANMDFVVMFSPATSSKLITFSTVYYIAFLNFLTFINNIWELSWMSHGWMSYALLISLQFSFHFGFLWYSSFGISFPRFFKWLFKSLKILKLRHSHSNYQICWHKLNLMCRKVSNQIITTPVVHQVVFCYY